MSALSGSLTYSRFFADQKPPKDFRERYMRAIRHRVIQPLRPDDEDLTRTGFCRIAEPFELELSPTSVIYENFINLGVRTDRWVFPSSLIKARVREAEAVYLEKKGRQRLSRHEKTELKLAVQHKLKQKLTPQIRSVDLSWSLDEQLVRYFTHSQKSIANMLELCGVQMESALQDSDVAVDTLIKAFTSVADTARLMNSMAEQLPADARRHIEQTLNKQLDEITRQIAAAVVSFQFYDKLTQRLGHVRYSLSSLGYIWSKIMSGLWKATSW